MGQATSSGERFDFRLRVLSDLSFLRKGWLCSLHIMQANAENKHASTRKDDDNQKSGELE